jgi:hypothetical protein
VNGSSDAPPDGIPAVTIEKAAEGGWLVLSGPEIIAWPMTRAEAKQIAAAERLALAPEGGYPPEAVAAPRPPTFEGQWRKLAWFVTWTRHARNAIRGHGTGYAQGYARCWSDRTAAGR